MGSAKQDVLSLLTEHFEHTPLTLIDDIINTVNELVYRAVTAVETGLNNTPSTGLGFHKARAAASDSNPDTSVLSQSEVDENGESLYPEKRAEVENGVHQLETLLEASVDKNFDKFEIYVLRNILSIRDGLERWVQLEHYKDLDFSHTAPSAHSPATAESVLHLRQKLHATRRLNGALSAEHRRNEALLTQLRAILSPRKAPSVSDFKSSNAAMALHNGDDASATNLAFFTQSEALQHLKSQAFAAQSKAAASKGSKDVKLQDPISRESRALITQLPQLRSLLTELRQAQDRGLSAPSLGSGGRSEQERRAYLEGAVRSGVGDGTSWPDKSGGATLVTGAATARGDFGAIEGIAANLATNATPTRDNGDLDTDMDR